MGLCRGSDSAFADRQISHTACGSGLVVYPKLNLSWTMERETLFFICRNSPTLEFPDHSLRQMAGQGKKVAPRASVDDPSLRRLLQGSLCCCH